MNSSFLALLFRMKHINRWGLMHNTCCENLSEHSFECALLAHFLGNIGNIYFNKSYDCDNLAVCALFHDASEVLTGDLPTPIKYFSDDITKAYKEMENLAEQKLLDNLPEELRDCYSRYFLSDVLSAEEKSIIKSADKLCAYIKCVQELNSGNKEFQAAFDSISKAVNSLTSDEVVYFRQNCLESFSLSLDKIKGTL